jgi:hypothetical protein
MSDIEKHAAIPEKEPEIARDDERLERLGIYDDGVFPEGTIDPVYEKKG